MARGMYEIRLNGLIPTDDLLEEIGDVDVAQHELRTVLRGQFSDQAQLHGFLNRLRAFGLEVVEVRRLPAADRGAGQADPADPGPDHDG